MGNSLEHAFAETIPRETSGSRSSNRFEYQKNWALCELLMRHSNEDDYLMVLDYHEDVVVFDQEHEPTCVNFYQVKTKNHGNWTVQALTKGDGNKIDSSYFGKLFSNYRAFPQHTRSLVFVSNQGLSATLLDGKKALNYETVTFPQLSIVDKEKMQKSVEGDNAQYCECVGLAMLSLSKTELGIKDHAAHTKGKLVEFFEQMYPKKIISSSLAYQTISDEIKRKTNREGTFDTMKALHSNKGIGRTDFLNMMGLCLNRHNPEELWGEVNQTLISENYVLTERLKIKVVWTEYLIDRMNVGNEPLLRFRESIHSKIAEHLAAEDEYKLKELVSLIKPTIDLSGMCVNEGESFVEAAIICEVVLNDPIQKAYKKPKEETK